MRSLQTIHPNLIVLPCVGHARSQALLRAVIDFLSERGDPMDVMVNHVLEVSTELAMQLYLLSDGERKSIHWIATLAGIPHAGGQHFTDPQGQRGQVLISIASELLYHRRGARPSAASVPSQAARQPTRAPRM